MDKSVINRIKKELTEAGIISKILINKESKVLASILYEDEHIGGAVHGTYSGGLAWLIATNKRILFMDRKPLFSSMDEISYEVVSGTKNTATNISDSVTIHTRVGDYTVNYIRAESAHIFIHFIEEMRLGNDNIAIPTNTNSDKETFSRESINFLRTHNLGVLSTIDRTGNIHGAVVYYLIDQDNFIYILTKSGTSKGRNILASSKVAMTIFEEKKLQTVQLQGDAVIETNQINKNAVYQKITQPRKINNELKAPPVTKLKDGEYMIIKIKPTYIKYSNYN